MNNPAAATDLRSVLTTLARQRWIIAGVAGVALVGAVAWSLLTPSVYASSAELVIEPDVPMDDPELVGRALFQVQELATQQRLATSDLVLDRATEAAGVPRETGEDVVAEVLPDTRVMLVTTTSADPEQAEALTTAVVEEFLEVRTERATQELDRTRQEAQQRVGAAEAELDELDAALEEVGTTQNAFVSALQAERYQAVEALQEANTHLGEVEASIEAQTGGGRVIEPATVPTAAVGPGVPTAAGIALVLGLGLGVVAALVRDTLDDAVRDDDDVAAATGRPVLGRIPARQAGGARDPVLLHAPASPDAEAYRDLRANLRFAATELRSVTVTAAHEGEGTSSVAANLAVAAALAGFDVVLVDAALRHPQQHRLLGAASPTGLAQVLAGDEKLESAVQRLDAPPLSLLPAGATPPNPSELLGSQALADVLEELAGVHDVVVIDTPAVLGSSDAQEVASLTDATLLVVADGRTGRRSLRESTQRLARAGAPLTGAVVSGSEQETEPAAGLLRHVRERSGA